MFCRVLRVFCDVLRVFCGVLRVFSSISTKHPKNTGKHKKTHNCSNIAGVFQEQKNSTVLHKTPFTKHLQNTAKHRKSCKTPQNSHKTRFVKLRRKTLQNAHKTLENVAKNAHNTAAIRIARIRCFLPKCASRSVAKAYNNNNTQYTRKLRRGGHVPAGGHVAGLWMFFKNRKQCFAVFCGILRCFAVFYVRVFSVFHETAQNRPTSNKYTKRTKRTKYALCNTAQYGAVHLLLTQKICLQKNIRKTRPKHCKNPQNTAKHCFSKNTRKTPQNSRKTPTKHRKTPQNTTKHICLLTKQTEY